MYKKKKQDKEITQVQKKYIYSRSFYKTYV